MNFNKKYISLVLLTAISGLLSGSGNFFTHSENWIVYAPGIIFGVILGIWFFITQKTNPVKTILWFIASAIAYYSAFWAAIFTNSNFFPGNSAYPFIIAGLVGTTILSVGTYFFITKIDLGKIYLLILIGGIAGLFFNLDIYKSGLLSPFIFWQMAVGIALGIMVDRKKKNINTNLN
jgi:hypothetical protein